jgi:riboflavin-specific deaminase-like protein
VGVFRCSEIGFQFGEEGDPFTQKALKNMFIFSNLAISLDGKIATQSRAHFPLGTKEDRRMMGVLRSQADAVIVGAGTLRSFHAPMLNEAPVAPPSKSRRSRQPMNIVVSSSLEGLSVQWSFFKEARTRKIVFTYVDTPQERIKRFSKVAEVLTLSRPSARKPLAPLITAALEKLGVKRLLVEGGGGLMWDFARANLIDEYCVTLTPRILGGAQAPTLVDGDGFTPKQVLNLKLKECRRFGDELYLVYRKTLRRG